MTALPSLPHQHGDARRYWAGCRCDLCKAANARYQKVLRQPRKPKP